MKTCVATAAPLSVRKPTKPAPKEGPVFPGVRLPESRPVVSSVSCLPRSAAQAAAQGASTSSHLRCGATVGVLSSRRWRAAYAIAAEKKKDAARALVVRLPGAAREPLRHVRGAALLASHRRRRLTRSDERLLRRGALALSQKPVVALGGALVV